MGDDYQIHLNFLPVLDELPVFQVYRKKRLKQEPRPDPETRSYSLPITSQDKEKRDSYWVRVTPLAGFEAFQTQSTYNHDLTRWVLFLALYKAAQQHLQSEQFYISKNRFLDEVSFVMKKHNEGEELLIIQPYFLRATGQFGCLADFHFRLGQGIPFSRKIQQLSLTLDRNFRRNLDYYVDYSSRIRKYVQERKAVLESLRFPGTAREISIGNDFVSLPANRLNSKIYIFASGKEAKSQFTGLRDFGPLKPLESQPKLLFIFREQERLAARALAVALRGSKLREQYSFPGFNSLFKTDIQIDSNPVIMPDLSEQSFSNALQRIKNEKQKNVTTIPILILPDSEEAAYLSHKAMFAHEGIPTQVCRLPTIQDDTTLKWAIANIALQIFCKGGGQPWKVRPAAERSLIIGISQSHKIRIIDTKPVVEKYFAFSVMTDSSGLFQRIQVLGEEKKEATYLQQLRTSLRQIVVESAEKFPLVVIHTSFKLKRTEMAAIEETVRQISGEIDRAKCRFAVVKVNQKSRFFGINRGINSLVPYEATSLKLGHGEYLVWFEGIFPDKPTVSKAFPGPTHLQFLAMSSGNDIRDEVLLQDLVNLSGANWRGFNAKSAPISVFYCHLVADLVHDFHERGLPLPAVEDLRPWFL